jgi:hypothetical protein
MEWKTIKIEAPGISSLCWCGDELVDFVDGGVRYRLDGSKSARLFEARPDFDAAICSDDEKFVVLYQRRGEKGLILRGNASHPIKRDGYYSSVHDYPIAIWKWVDGRYVMAHCPESYNRLEIDYLDTGERITTRLNESPDYFHSRLSISPDGRYLMSCGWFWGSYEWIQAYDLSHVSQDPEKLDQPISPVLHGISQHDAEIDNIGAAVFMSPEHALISAYVEGKNRDSYQAIWNIRSNQVCSMQRINESANSIMPLNSNHSINFYETPYLVELSTGQIIFSWHELDAGKSNEAKVYRNLKGIYIATDPKHSRFAVASNNELWVVMFKG